MPGLQGTERAALMRDYNANGYALCPNLLSEQRRADLIACAQRLRAQGDYTPLMHPHRLNGGEGDMFMEALCDPRAVAIMQTVLDGEVQGLQSDFFFGKPGTLGFACHQDNFYVRSNPETFASLWIALSDVGPDNGGLFFHPGTHREPILDVVETNRDHAGNQDVNAHRIECVLPEKYRRHCVDLRLPAGDGAVFHGHTVHGSHDHSGTRWRHALLLTYVRKGAPFRPGNHSGRRRVDVVAKQELDAQ